MLVLPVKLKYIKITYVKRLQCRKTTAENPNKSELDFISCPATVASGLTLLTGKQDMQFYQLFIFSSVSKVSQWLPHNVIPVNRLKPFIKVKRGLCSPTNIWAWDTIRLVSVSVSPDSITSPLLQNTRTFSNGYSRNLPLGVFHFRVTLTTQNKKLCYLEMMLQFYQSFLSFLKVCQAILQDMSA